MSKIDGSTHKIKLELPDDVQLEILLHSHFEHKWFFKYRFLRRETESPMSKIIMENEIKLIAGYFDGKLENFEVNMNFTNYNKLGKKFFVGMDISPGSKLFLQYRYEKVGDDYHLKEIETTSPHRIIKIEEGIIPSTENYFILPDKIEQDDWGNYKFPFETSEGKTTYFIFPSKTI